jgi:hypothetical protein
MRHESKASDIFSPNVLLVIYLCPKIMNNHQVDDLNCQA